MATFNTAFGSLPTPEDELFGSGGSSTATSSGGGQTGTTSGTSGSTMNFADLQKNGYARPAPPLEQTQAPTSPPLLSTLQTQLSTPTPAPAAAPIPAVGAVNAPPVASTSAPDSAITTGVTTPVLNPPKYKEGEVPPANAPDGSTFQRANGIIWTKRGGIWVTGEGPDQAYNDPRMFGYQGITPPELLQQSNAGAAAAGVHSTSLGSGVDYFLQQYGLPSTPEEWANLSALAGMSVDQLRAKTTSEPWRYQTQKQITDLEEQKAWMNDPANRSQISNGIPYGMVFVPASEGGPGLRRMTYEEVSAGGNEPYGGRELWENPDKYKAQIIQAGEDFNARMDAEEFANRPAFRAAGQSGSRPSTGSNSQFAGGSQQFTTGGSQQFVGGRVQLPDYSMLANLGASLGMGGGGGGGGGASYAGSTQAKALREQLQQQLAKMEGGSELQRQALEASRKAKAAELSAEFGAQRSKLEEELAGRGLSASTIGGGRYGDLAGQQARATATLESDIMKQQAEAEARDRALYMSTMSGLAEMAGTQDLGEFEANLKASQVASDIAFRAAELQQEAALKGRDLDLQQARDIATSQYQSGQLKLGYAEMGSREKMQREGQTFQSGESALERQLRSQLQKSEITSQEKIAGLDRDLRNKIASGELTLNQGIALGNIAQRIYDGSLPLEAWDSLLAALGLDPAKYPRPRVKDIGSGDSGGSGGSGGSGNPPRQENPPPANTLSNYTPGTRFNIRGVIYTLDSSGRLIDSFGNQYNYSNAE